eukprot:1473-Heterococcus_DN1.PRE.1
MYQHAVTALLRHVGAITTGSGTHAKAVLACTLNGAVQCRRQHKQPYYFLLCVTLLTSACACSLRTQDTGHYKSSSYVTCSLRKRYSSIDSYICDEQPAIRTSTTAAGDTTL